VIKHMTALCAVVLTLTTAGCVVPERSREMANPATRPAVMAVQVCSTCHGVDGNATSPNFPNLAAQQEGYLVAQLKGFRSQGRSDPAGFEYMWGLSKHLTDEQIAGLAAYFAQQRPVVLPVSDAKAAEGGKEIFERGIAEKNIPACATCHGPQAQGKDTFPRLAGQHADYIQKQLLVFQRTDQRPAGAVMKTIAHDLSPRDMQSVAVYLQGLTSQ
jgi:cytochrome c553